MKKLSLTVIVFILMLVLSSCMKDITIDGDASVSLKEGDTFDLSITTNDEDGLIFESSNLSVVTVSESGVITAVSMGEAVIKVTSRQDQNVTFEVNVEVKKNVNLTSSTTQIVLVEGNEHDVIYESNDDVTFKSSATDIFTVDNKGIITGVKAGSGVLTITSVNDETKSITVQVTVRKIVTLEITDYTQMLVVGEEGMITVDSEEEYTYQSGDETVLTVDLEGKVTPVSAGETTVTVRSTYDLEVFDVITIKVYEALESFTIDGSRIQNIYHTQNLSASIIPLDAYPYYTWESSNPDVLSVDANGLLTAHAIGSADITVKSTLNELISETITVQVVNKLLVDGTVSSGTIVYNQMTYTYGVDLFSSIQAAVDHALDQTMIYINPATYQENVTLNKLGLSLEGIGEVVVTGNMVVDHDNISLKNFKMQGASSITSNKAVVNLSIQHIEASDITGDFIILKGTKLGLMISDNDIQNVVGFAIKVEGYESGVITIKKNMISNAETAISITPALETLQSTEIKVERNDISNVTDGITIETNKDIHAYARFNSVVEATGYLAKSNEGNEVEFTLNHWGMETLDLLKFSHIDEDMLLGHYALKTQIISEVGYNPLVPVKIMITNPITELLVGDSYQFTIKYLPYDLVNPSIKWITSAPTISIISQNGSFTPLKSGQVTFTVRSQQNISVNAIITVDIITLPGIEIATSTPNNENLVGETLKLDATPFPSNIKDEPVTFTSSDETKATVTVDGLVSLHQAGLVTISASLTDDPLIKTDFKFEIYESLDNQNLMDLLTKSMVTYTTPHRWTAYGVGFDYADFKYESVSKFYFGTYSINTSKMVPVSSGIRPGEPMDPHPEGITQYNSDNVYWVVIHDTANTNPGSGALAHANYLYGNAMAGNELWASWHFTVDDLAIYQHIPTYERAFHAGDGSTRPGTAATYLGGGNRNGIGIETGVNSDADVYRIWQRTAKLGIDLLMQYNLPLENMRYHVDFSGKNCPQTMRNAGLVPLFEEMKSYEYQVAKNFSGAEITFVSHDTEYVDNTGRVIKMPDKALTVSYTVTVSLGGETVARTFYSYLPGTIH